MAETSRQNAVSLSDHVQAEIRAALKRYPADQKRSAVQSALHAAQHDNGGYLTVALMDAVAQVLEMSPIEVYEVATFYSMLETEPVGRNSVSVCTNISCMLRGADDILAHVENRLGIARGQSTADGRVYLKCEEECLAACAGAPMMMVNHVYYENLTPEKVDEILDNLD